MQKNNANKGLTNNAVFGLHKFLDHINSSELIFIVLFLELDFFAICIFDNNSVSSSKLRDFEVCEKHFSDEMIIR